MVGKRQAPVHLLVTCLQQEQVLDDQRPRTYSPRRRYTPSPLPPPSRRSLPDLSRAYHFNWYNKEPRGRTRQYTQDPGGGIPSISRACGLELSSSLCQAFFVTLFCFVLSENYKPTSSLLHTDLSFSFFSFFLPTRHQ